MPLEELPSLVLYHSRSCVYCLDVRSEIERLGLDVALLDVGADEAKRQVLVRELGRRTVPVLRIQSRDGQVTWLPESLDIIEYLGRLSPGRAGRSRWCVRVWRLAPLAGLVVALALPPALRVAALAFSAALFALRVRPAFRR